MDYNQDLVAPTQIVLKALRKAADRPNSWLTPDDPVSASFAAQFAKLVSYWAILESELVMVRAEESKVDYQRFDSDSIKIAVFIAELYLGTKFYLPAVAGLPMPAQEVLEQF